MERRWRSSGGLLMYGLAAIAVAQITILAFVGNGSAGGASTIGPGYDFGSVEVLDQDSVFSRLATGVPMLVLVFHSECRHCQALAPTWAEWLRDRPSTIKVLAVSREPPADALAYAMGHGWEVEVRSVVLRSIGGPARNLVRRTPWVFALDAQGTVVAAAHGSEVDRMAAALLAGPAW